MIMRNILKLGVASGLLVLALSLTGYAASVTSVNGTDGVNAFATSADALTADTALESTLTVSGTVDIDEANVTIMISAEDTIVYVNQIVADEDGDFEFEFPVTLEAGYIYEVKVNTENSEKASELYFKTAALHYGDIDSDDKVTLDDAIYIARKYSNLTLPNATVMANLDAGLGDIDGINGVTLDDAIYVARKYSKLSVPVGGVAEKRLAWYVAQ